MNKSIYSPSRYIRATDGLNIIGNYVKAFGTKAIVFGGNTSVSVTSDTIAQSLVEYGIQLGGIYEYGGECSHHHIDRLIEIVKDKQPDAIIVVGGGKAIDTVKTVSFMVQLPLIVVPTIAATCAATTPVSVLYDNHGVYLETRKSKAPEVVLVDTSIISKAPIRYLTAGIGDTIAKWFEFNLSIQKLEYTATNRAALVVAEEIYKILTEYGPEVVKGVSNNTTFTELQTLLDHVIDSIILLGGMVSSYSDYDSPTAAAHAIYSGLTIFPEVHEYYHGEIVAFGILAQMVMEGRSREAIKDVIHFYQKVRLPYTLKELGLSELTSQQWTQLGEYTVQIEDISYMPFEVTTDMVIESIKMADQIGREVIENENR